MTEITETETAAMCCRWLPSVAAAAAAAAAAATASCGRHYPPSLCSVTRHTRTRNWQPKVATVRVAWAQNQLS